MQQLIIIILTAYFFALNFVVINQIPKTIKKILKIHHTKRLKPIDCVYCLSCWSALVLYFAPEQMVNCLFVFFTAGILSHILTK